MISISIQLVVKVEQQYYHFDHNKCLTLFDILYLYGWEISDKTQTFNVKNKKLISYVWSPTAATVENKILIYELQVM